MGGGTSEVHNDADQWLAADGRWYPSSHQPDYQGAGWWLASDGRWYAPEQRYDALTSRPSGWSRTWPWLAVSAAGFTMVSVLVGLAAGPEELSDNVRVQSVRPAAPGTTERVGPATTTRATTTVKPTTTARATTTTAAPTTTAPTTTAPPTTAAPTTVAPPPTAPPPPPTTPPPPPTTAYVPPPAPFVEPVAPDAGGSFKNCDAARAAGAAPVRVGDPGYGRHLDRDGDGVGCET